MLRLDDEGIPVRVARDSLQTELTFGGAPRVPGWPVRAVVTLAGPDQIPTIGDQPGARRIAFVRTPKHAEDLAAFTVPAPVPRLTAP